MKLPALFTFVLIFSINSVVLSQDSGEESRKRPILLKSKSASAGYYDPVYGQSGGSIPSYNFKVGSDGKVQRVDFFGGNLKDLVKDNDEALEQMNIFAKKRKNMVTGFVMVGGGVLLTALGVEKTGEQTFDPRTGQNEDKYGFKPIGFLGLGMAITGIIVAGVNGNGASKYVENAVQAYNEGLEVSSSNGETSMKINFGPTISPDFVGAGFKVSLF